LSLKRVRVLYLSVHTSYKTIPAFPPQVQEALEEAPSDPDGTDECELGSERCRWKERTSEGSDWHGDSREGEDEFSALLGAEHLYTGWHLENGLESAQHRAQQGEDNRNCRGDAQNSHCNTEDLNKPHRDVQNLGEVCGEQRAVHNTGDLTVHHITACNGRQEGPNAGHTNTYSRDAEERTVLHNTADLKTQDTTGTENLNTVNTGTTGVAQSETHSEPHNTLNRDGTREETASQDFLRSSCSDHTGTSTAQDERIGSTGAHSQQQHCVNLQHVHHCVDSGLQWTDACSLNDSDSRTEHSSHCTGVPNTEIHECTDISRNESLHSEGIQCTDPSGTHESGGTEVETALTETVGSDIIEARFIKAFRTTRTNNPGQVAPCQPSHSPQADTQGTGHGAQPSPDTHHRNPGSTAQESGGKGSRTETHSAQVTGSCSRPTSASDPSAGSETCSVYRHCPVRPGRATSTQDTSLVYATEASEDITASAESSDGPENTAEERCSISHAGHDAQAQACGSDAGTVFVSGVQSQTTPACSADERASPDLTVDALAPPEEAGFPLPSIPWLVRTEGTEDTEAGTDSRGRQWGQSEQFLTPPCPGNFEDAAQLNSQVVGLTPSGIIGSASILAEEFEVPLTVQARELSSEEGKDGKAERVCEDTLSSYCLSLQPGQPVDPLPLLLLNHSDLKDINSQSPELPRSSNLTVEKDGSCCSLSTEEKVEDRSQASARSKEKDSELRPSVERQLCPPQSAVHASEFTAESLANRDVPRRAVQIHGPLFIERECRHQSEQPIDPPLKQTRVIDLEHIDSPRSDITVTRCPETSTTEITVDPRQASSLGQDIPGPQLDQPCRNLSVPAALKVTEAGSVERFYSPGCERWLEPFSDGPESDSEDSDQRDSLHQDKSDHKASEQELDSASPEGAKKSSDRICRLEHEAYWSSEDSAVSGLGEDCHCDLVQPQNECPGKSPCPNGSVGVNADFCRGPKKDVDSKACAVVHAGVDHLTHSARCEDNHQRHTHTSLCTDCVHEAALDCSLSNQPWPEVLELPASRLETKGHLQPDREQTVPRSLQPSCSVFLDCHIDSHCIETFSIPLPERGNTDHTSLCQGSVDTENTETSVTGHSSQSSQATHLDIHHRSTIGTDSERDRGGHTGAEHNRPFIQSTLWVAHSTGPGLLPSRSLEPIPETERCLEFGPAPEDKASLSEKEVDAGETGNVEMKPAESDRDILGVTSGMLSSSISEGCEGKSEVQSCPPSSDQNGVVSPPPVEVIPAESLATGSVELDSSSVNSEDLEEQRSPPAGKSHKSTRTKTKPSKFSVFAKMPSFRRGKSTARDGKGSKGHSPEGSVVDLLFYRSHLIQNPDLAQDLEGQGGDNSDDEVFYKSDALNQTAHQASSGSQVDTEDEGDEGDDDSLVTLSSTGQIQDVSDQRTAETEASGLMDTVKQSTAAECSGYRRSKSTEGLSLRLRFAQAHKSLSSLFESRGMDKDSEERDARPEAEEVRPKPSWRKQKRAKEAELLRRTMSVPDSDRPKATRLVHSDYASRTTQEQLGQQGAAQCHSDPLSKRAVSQDGFEGSPQGSKSEGRRRKCPPNGLSISFSDSGRLSSDDSSEAPPPGDSSPLSPMTPLTPSTLASQLSPSWSKSSPSTNDSAESPMRPMSPKPSSPRSSGSRRGFRYPSSRANTLSLILLGQGGASVPDPPERPRTLKPKVGRQGSLSPLGSSLPLEDSSADSQSQVSLVSASEFEPSALLKASPGSGRVSCQSPVKRTVDGSPSPAGPSSPGPRLRPVPTGRRFPRKRCCSDDLRIEEEKRRERRLARAGLTKLRARAAEETEKAGIRLSLSTMEVFPGLPLRALSFSHSAPTGLDCLSWRRRMSYPCKY
ncbi:hypothetical protein NFI96_017231, partial [Prochilodus magdalenae]